MPLTSTPLSAFPVHPPRVLKQSAHALLCTLAGLLCLSLLSPRPAWAGEVPGMPPGVGDIGKSMERVSKLQNSAWTGTVQYVHKMTESNERESKTSSTTLRETCSGNLGVKVIWDVCIVPGEETQSREHAEVTGSGTEERRYTEDSSVCQEASGKGVPKSPGHGSTSVLRYTYSSAPKGEDKPVFSLTFFPDGQYMIGVASQAAMQFKMTGSDEHYNACSGKTTREEQGPFGDELRLHPVSALAMVPIRSEDALSGQKLLDDVNGRAACFHCRTGKNCSQTTALNWNLRRVDACSKVQERLAQTRRMLECYLNPAFASVTRDPFQYKTFVDRCLTAGAKPGPGGEKPEPYEEAVVGANCKLYVNKGKGKGDEEMSFEQYKDSLKQGDYFCEPTIIVDALIEHEQIHFEQCKSWGERYSNPSPQDLREAERLAYCHEAQRFIDYLKENCTAPAREMEKTIEAMCK